jgi:hypothetical protein
MDELDELLTRLRPRLNERKLRLLPCSAARKAWHLLKDPRSRRAVEVAERFADGQATIHELGAASRAAARVPQGDAVSSARYAALALTKRAERFPDWWWGLCYGLRSAAGGLAAVAARAVPDGGPWVAVRDSVWDAARAAQRALILDLVGPDPPVPLDPSWLAWKGGTVRKLAEAIYQGRRFADLPILADALEEAGCMEAEILGHCRSRGEHGRGCWVIDLLLGKS